MKITIDKIFIFKIHIANLRYKNMNWILALVIIE